MKITPLHWTQTIPIRQRVLWPNKPPEFCHVAGDEDALHFGALVDDKLVSIISLYISGSEARFRKFATLAEYQRRGIGSKLLTHVISSAQEKGIARIWCDARATAVGFYERFGLTVEGEMFYKSDVAYYKMERAIKYNAPHPPPYTHPSKTHHHR